MHKLNGLAVGISSTAVESGLGNNCLDGIGVTTVQLMRSLSKDFAVTVRPYAFPAASMSSVLFKDNTSLLPEGAFWSHPFSVMTAFSLLFQKTWSTSASKLKFDLYHALDYRIPKLNCPVIASLHDATLLKYPHWIRSQYRSIKTGIVLRTMSWVNHVITLSQAMVPDIVEYFRIPPEKITVVPLGVDSSWFVRKTPEEISEIQRRYKLPAHYILFVGTLQPRKNIKRMLEAYMCLKPHIRKGTKLVIVGRLGWNTDEFMPLLRNLMEKNEVFWTQYVPEEDLKCLYQAASCLLFPSLYEGFGLPVLEAFASQIPVLTSNTSALPEISKRAGLEVDPRSVEEIATSLERLIEDETLRKRCVENGLIRAREMTWQSVAQKTLQVYEQFV